jgi:very-short-patch-repair endonuclease
MQNISFVICEICKAQKRELNGHLKMHKISSETYQKLFPNSPIMCREVTDMKSSSISKSIKNRPPITEITRKKMAIARSKRWEQLKSDLGEEAYYTLKREATVHMRSLKGNNFTHSEETKQKMRGPRPNACKPKSEETKIKLSIAAKSRPIRSKHTPETIQKMKEAWERRKLDKETYEKYIQNLSACRSTPESIVKIRNNVVKRLSNPTLVQKQYDTKPELKFQKFLELYNIAYDKQYIISTSNGSWTYDFILLDKNILVEIDGEYWHAKSLEQINRDKIKSKLARENGFSLARISDKNFNPDIIFESIDKIWDQNDKILSTRLLRFL